MNTDNVEEAAPQILIVDDVHANLRLLMEMLSRQHYKVRVVDNGQHALVAARADPPDLILLDIKMPGMDGYEVCAQLKASVETCNIPIIFISALDAVADKVRAFKVGGADYISKPFKNEEVLARIETHLALRIAQEQLAKQNAQLHQANAELARLNTDLQAEIVKREQTESELRESEARFRELAELLPQIVFEVDAQGQIKYVNRHAFESTGYTQADVERRRSVFEIIVPQDHERVKQNIANVLQGTASDSYEYTLRRKDGSTFPVLIYSAPIVRDQVPVGLRGIIVDISERKKAAVALQESEEKFRSVVEQANDGIVLIDTQGIIVEWNRGQENITGIAKDVVLGRSIGEVFSRIASDKSISASDFQEQLLQIVDDLLEREPASHYQQEREILHPDGTRRVVQVMAFPIKTEAGVLIGSITRDITKSRQAEAALRASEQRYRRLVENAPVGIISVDTQGQVVDVNPKILEILGSPSAGATRAINVLTFPPLVESGIATDFETCLKFGALCTERLYTTKWGKQAYLRMHLTPVHDEDHTPLGVQAIVEDITVRKQAQEALQKAYRRLDDIIDFLPDATFVIDQEGKIIAWNRAMEAMTGVSKQDMLHKGEQAYAVPFYGERRPLLVDLALLSDEAFERANYTHIKRQEDLLFAEAYVPDTYGGQGAHLWGVAARLRDETGQVVGAIESIRDINDRKLAERALRGSEERFAAVMNSIEALIYVADMQTYELLFINEYTRGLFGDVVGEVCWQALQENQEGPCDFCTNCYLMEDGIPTEGYTWEFQNTATANWYYNQDQAIRWTDGRWVRLEVATDISALKQAEAQLQEYADELEAHNIELDAFAHTVAHDLKNPLAALIGISQLLEKRHTTLAPEKLQQRLGVISQIGYKMTSIIDELLLLSSIRRVEEVATERLDMASIVREAQNRLSNLLTQHEVEIIIPSTWPAALGYAPWIEEVWVNYISNAIKYGGVPPRVELGATVHHEGWVRFWVCDNGNGIAPEEQAVLFTEFTRLSEVRAEGHGLGLSIVRRIAEKLGGDVGVESTVGQGSCFFFTLPSTDCEAR